MMGVRVGSRVGMRIGMAVGMTADPISSATSAMAGVTMDSSSGVFVPSTAGEWTITMAAAGLATGNPSAVHLLQDASGNPADAVGTFTLTASGTGITYAQTVAGWNRKAINTLAGASGMLTNTDAGLPSLATQSALAIVYAKTTTSAGQRAVLSAGVAATPAALLTNVTTGTPRVVCGANVASGASDMGGAVRPHFIRFNRTATTMTGGNEQEKVAPTFGTTAAGQQITLGQLTQADCTASYLYAAWFFAGAAELTDAQLRTLLQTLGWTIAW